MCAKYSLIQSISSCPQRREFLRAHVAEGRGVVARGSRRGVASLSTLAFVFAEGSGMGWDCNGAGRFVQGPAVDSIGHVQE